MKHWVKRIRDPMLFVLTLVATGLGLLLIFDAGYPRSLLAGRSVVPREFLMQLVFLPVAFIVSMWLAKSNIDTWCRWSKAIWVLSLLSLVAVAIPGIGIEMNGAHRWLGYGPIKIQPAEFVKLTTIIYLAGVFADRKQWPKKIPMMKNLAEKLDRVAIPKLMRIMPGIWVLLAVVMIEQEPDLGTAAVVAVIAACMFIAGGVTRKTLIWGAFIAFVGVGLMVIQQPYRLERITSHQHRWSAENVDDTGYQTVQSELGMASGGIVGVGIGAGRAKHVMPATTTDFVMATVGEEFGLIGSLVVLGVLGFLTLRLLSLAQRTKNSYGRMILVGVAGWIGIQTCVNVMMANGFLPAIGIPLPFISSGGSSLVALWAAMGLCQSALAPAPVKEAVVETSPHGWRNRRTHLSRA